jgi:hypothetical protein
MMMGDKPLCSSVKISIKSILQTDVYLSGVGVVLEQEADDGRQPIMFISKNLNKIYFTDRCVS